RHDFAIEHDRSAQRGNERPEVVRDLRELLRLIVSITRDEGDRIGGCIGEDANPVVLRLEGPITRSRDRTPTRGEHGLKTRSSCTLTRAAFLARRSVGVPDATAPLSGADLLH